MTTDKRTFTITHRYEIGFGAALIGAALRGENLRDAAAINLSLFNFMRRVLTKSMYL